MSYKVYPITKTDLFTENYIIKINGKEYLADTTSEVFDNRISHTDGIVNSRSE